MINILRIPSNIIDLVSSDIAWRYRAIPVEIGSHREIVFYAERDLAEDRLGEVQEGLEEATGKNVRLKTMLMPHRMNVALNQYYPR